MPKNDDPLADLLKRLEVAERERITETGKAAVAAARYCLRLAEDAGAGYAKARLIGEARGWLNAAITADDKLEARKVAEALEKIDAKRKHRNKLQALT